jgi:hypothetical protein
MVQELEVREVPAWVGIGPAPELSSQAATKDFGPFTGRVSALAVSGNRLLLGAAGGGIWYSDDALTTDNPTWHSTNTDTLGLDTLDRRTGLGAGFIDIGCIAVDPNNQANHTNIVYAGTGESVEAGDGRYGSGILWSDNNGQTWKVLATGIPGNPTFFRQSISKIIVDPTNSNRLFVAVSTDENGDNFGPTTDDGIYRVVLGPGNRQTWTKLTKDNPGPNTDKIGAGIKVTDLDYTWDAWGHRLVLYAGVASNGQAGINDVGGIWRSTDGGDTWIHIGQAMNPPGARRVIGSGTPAPGDVLRVEFAADHASGHTQIYAIVAKRTVPVKLVSGDLLNVYETNNGLGWTPLTRPSDHFLGDQGSYTMAIALDPASGNLFIGGRDTGNPQKEGMVWEYVGGAGKPVSIDVGLGKVSPHADQQAYLVANGQLYAGTDGGLWRYTPRPAWAPAFITKGFWDDLNSKGLSTSQLFSVARDPVDPNYLLAAMQDNGVAQTLDAGANWYKITGADGIRVGFGTPSGQFGPAKGTPYRAAEEGDFERSANGQWYKATPPGNNDYPFRTVFAVNPKVPGLVLLASKTSVWRSNNAGKDWKDLGRPSRGGGVITTLTYAPLQEAPGRVSQDKVAFVGYSNGEVWWTQDATAANVRWTRVTGARWGNRRITGIAADPNHPGFLYLTVGSFIDRPADPNAIGQVWMTEDYGKSWENISGNRDDATSLPNVPAWSVVVDPRSPNLASVFVGTDTGVYQGVRSPRLGAAGPPSWAWTRLDSGLPNVQVMGLDLQTYATGSVLTAATHGRGAWSLNLGRARAQAVVPEGAAQTGLAVATFADPGGSGPYTATVDPGDGTGTISGTVTSSGGTLTVSINHTWAEAGDYAVTATVSRTGASFQLTSTVEVDDAALSASAATVSGNSYTALSNATVATFTDADTLSVAGDFAATIDWGDGTVTDGTVSGSSGSYTVRGSHTYTDAGSFAVTVDIADPSGVATASVADTATITGSVSAQAAAVSATEAQSTGTVTVATFTASSGSSFTAKISWGDGHVSDGTVTSTGGSSYSVSGSNTYAAAGDFPLGITILSSGTPVAFVQEDVAVAPAALTALGMSLSPTQGQALNDVVVAHFTDADPNRSAQDYSVSLDWGDDPVPWTGPNPPPDSVGTVIAEGNGTFAVLGSHTYLQSGPYTLTVGIEGPTGATADVSNPISVAAAAPSVSGLDTKWGAPQGGAVVTISGTALYGATAVSFGGTAATAFVVNADGSITAVAPSLTAGTTVDVTVTTPYGTSATSTADKFTALNAAPTVSGLSPSSGPTGGGTSVTISGTGLSAATAVLFWTTPAAFVINSDTSITATAPANTATTADVTVVNPFGTSATSSADHYTWAGTAPSVTGTDTPQGPAAGGAVVLVVGVNFNGASAVSFGATAAPSFTVLSPTALLATAPALTAGTYDITVTSAYGTSSTSSADQFTAVAAPTVTGLSSTSGPTGGGGSVTVTGTGFTGAGQVLFGTVAAPGFTVNSATSITVTVPASSSGAVTVSVVTAGGTSAPGSGTTYTYNATAPTVTALGTARGPTAGGTSVVITGANLNGATSVLFGTTAAAFTAVSATEIDATAPAGSVGFVYVTVTTPYGTSGTSSASQFTYADAAAPAVTGVSVSGAVVPSGATAGGTTVVLTGTGFTAATQVLFGGAAATSYTVNSDTQITVTSPGGPAGTVDVQVATPYGSSSASSFDEFTYLAATPSVSSLDVSSGTTAGGDAVTIGGSNLTGAIRVAFGGADAASFTVNADNSITAVTPLHTSGLVDVTVVGPAGTSATGSADHFTFNAATGLATVTGLGTTSGPTGGGTSVAITGTNFTNVTGVSFGSQAAASYTVNSATSITAVSPAATSGAVTVSVATTAGVSAAGSGTTFTYNATAPSVSGLSPTSGATAGGTSVVITGLNLNGATAVSFGGTAATGFSVDSPTQITATAPAGSAGTINVTVTTPYGTSSTSSASQFTYVAAPTVSTLSVSSGPTAGGTSVTITGTNFTGLVAVSFGGVPAATLTVNSSTSLTVTTPASGPGAVDVVVTAPLGSSAAVTADQFTYTDTAPAVTGVSPSGGALAGGGSVTITGTGFTNAQAVYFGGTGASYTVNSATQITATAPAGAAGAVDVQVVDPYGLASAPGTADQYTYYDVPVITALSPGSDTKSGGVPVTITGTNLAGATAVTFGGVAAAGFTVNSPTSITAVTPAQSGTGAVNVVVTTPGGTSAAASFSYTASNAVSWVGPSSGSWGTASNWSGGAVPGAGDDVTIGSGVTVTHSSGTDSVHRLTVGGTLTLSGGTLSVGATSTVANLTQSGGTLAGAGTLTVSGSFSWTGGTQSGPGTTAIASGGAATINSSTSALTLSGRTLNNSGAVTWSGTNALQLNDGAVWNDLSGSTFLASNNAAVTATSGTGTFGNAGTFTKSGGAGTTSFASAVAFNNTGTVNVLSGTLALAAGTNSATVAVSSGATLNFTGSYTLTSTSGISGSGSVVFSGGTTTIGGTLGASSGVTVQSGAAITGAATINANVTNSGTIHVGGGPGVAGRLTINGNFTQTSTGVLNVELGGLNAGTDSDQLVISGTASLGGTLNVSLLNGFVPASGNSFSVLTFASSTGTFATVTGLSQDGSTLTPQYNSTNLTLTASLSGSDAPDDDLLPAEEDGVPSGPGDRVVIATGEPTDAADGRAETEEAPEAAAWAAEVLAGGGRDASAVSPSDAFFVTLGRTVVPAGQELLSGFGSAAPAVSDSGDVLDLLAALLTVLVELL